MKRKFVLPCLTLTLAVALVGCSRTANADPTPSAPAVAPTESAEASAAPSASPSASPNTTARGFDRVMDDVGDAARDVGRGVGDVVGGAANGLERAVDGSGTWNYTAGADGMVPGWEPRTTTR